jgi:methylated-DNA-[protein]-cysteine S-methyltransferase
MEICHIETPLGHAKIVGDENGIASVSILNTTHELTEVIPEMLLDCVTQLKEYFNEDRKTFDIKLNPKGTVFQQRVWKQLETIPFGKSLSYLQLSKQLGDPKAIRAVANASGKNPFWIIVPCHRVIGSDGSLTGYAGGLHRKQWLLNHESEYKQQTLF